MFTEKMTNKGAMPRWIMAVARWVGKMRKSEPLRKGAAAAKRPEPVTEGEKALWQAMGWEE